MYFKVFETLIVNVIVCVLAFDDIFVSGQESHEMMEQGRAQYQLLKEKGNLPRYGTCWKGALDHVDDGCRNLSEDTQSDIALHITNCFLEMSGHSSYNCELNKKPNLRSICISSMSDRAFNVYTEFYTHVQNICWFLRGQIWYETISENSLKLGQQLQTSAKNQEELLQAQRESIEIQGKILQHEKLLEQVLGDLHVSSKAHQEILSILTKSVASFQMWVLEEASWFDSIIFYVFTCLFIFIVTSTKRTSVIRFNLLVSLFFSLLIERFICFILISEDSLFNTKLLYQDIYSYLWCWRYIFIFTIISYSIFSVFHYRDVTLENNKVLQLINQQNSKILEMMFSMKNNFIRRNSPQSDRFNLINENLHCNGFIKEGSYDKDETNSSVCSGSMKSRRNYLSRAQVPLTNIHNVRYNLRSSKQNTPELQ